MSTKQKAKVNETVLGFMLDITNLIKENDEILYLSGIQRVKEDPPSAAIHLTIARKEYMLILQPTDLP